jgi:NhaP-type Na+/H+ or K+/H+ antiporter
MRNFLYVVIGILLFGGAAGWLYVRQMSPLQDDAPAMSRQAAPDAPSASRSKPEAKDATRSLKAQRRIDRGLDQYRRPDGTWNTVSAVVDILNVVVGIIGIGLALSGMRARREARRDA